jgi:hypothetical protein
MASFEPGEYEVAVKVTGKVKAGSMDAAYSWLLRHLEPRLEARLGLEGVRDLSFSQEHARGPDNYGG